MTQSSLESVITFPIFFGTTEESFLLNRAKTRQWRDQKKQQQSAAFSTENGSTKTAQATQKTDLPKQENETSEHESSDSGSTVAAAALSASAASSAPKAWSAVLSKAIPGPVSKKEEHLVNGESEEASFNTNTTTQNKLLPVIKSGAIESMPVVLIRIMFQPNYVIATAPVIQPRGLVNTGNICFMSSILQLLLYCTPFHNTIKTIEKNTRASMELEKSQTPLLDATLSFFDEFKTHDKSGKFGSPLNSEKFFQAISKHQRFSHLRWGQQEDAEEFLGYYLDGLHEEFSAVLANFDALEKSMFLESIKNEPVKQRIKECLRAFENGSTGHRTETATEDATSGGGDGDDQWQEVTTSGQKNRVVAKRIVEIKQTPITRLFGGQFRSELEISKPKYSKSVTLDPFQHVQLDISDSSVNSLQSAFEFLSQSESISFDEGALKHGKKQTFIDTLPKVLVIHLKRFSYMSDNGSIAKIKKYIEYKHELEIPQSCLSKDLQQSVQVSKKYKLTGVVYHHGLNTDVGHYTVDVLKADKNVWVRFDDTQVWEVRKEDVVKNSGEEAKSAYILLYENVH